jgi:CubicO group peptidase (beta-lactamase class C family)
VNTQKIQKIFSLLILTIFISACSSQAYIPTDAQTTIVSENFKEIIRTYQQEIPQRMEVENIPGVAIAVVDDQSILWAEGFGFTDWDRRTPVTPNTLFSIQSMSKSFTATAAMLAAQDGLVDLDAPITTYLPDFHINSIFEEHPEQKITLRMLLSHTAGLAHEAPIGGNNDLPGHTFEEHIASISDTWLRSPVGTHWDYSNLGVDLAGYILQVQSGMPFTQYVLEKVLTPLGMTNSTLDIDQVYATPGRAIGHSPLPFRPPTEFLLIPSGGVWTTANDMARYLQFHINEGSLDGTRLLRQDLAETMYEPPNPVALDAEYALGIGTADWQGTRRFQHGGGGFGFTSNMLWYPELKLGVVVLTNTEQNNLRDEIVYDVLSSIISANIPLYHSRASTQPSVQPAYGFINNGQAPLTDGTLNELITSKALPTDEAARQRRQAYTGKYVMTRWGFPSYSVQVEENNGELIAAALGMSIKLSEVKPGLFFSPEIEPIVLTGLGTAPNLKLIKVNSWVMPFQITFYGLGGLVFLSTLFLWPVRAVVLSIRRKKIYLAYPSSPQTNHRWLPWNWAVACLAGLASLFSLLCLVAVTFIPNMVYVPWPRPYANLTGWQFALLSLPFDGLLLGIVIALLVGLTIRSSSWERATRVYYVIVAVSLIAFNLLIIL